MKILITAFGDQLEESLPASPTCTIQELKFLVERQAHDRLGFYVSAALSFEDGRAIVGTDTQQTLAALGLDTAGACVGCSLTMVPRLTRCEPPFGPARGGTLLRLRGSGFLESAGFHNTGGVRLSFGSGCSVPCWRATDNELQCRAPAHDVGIVNISLLNCEDAASAGSAAYEYCSEGRLCDLIFSTTNSHCPLRDVSVDEEERRRASFDQENCE